MPRSVRKRPAAPSTVTLPAMWKTAVVTTMSGHPNSTASASSVVARDDYTKSEELQLVASFSQRTSPGYWSGSDPALSCEDSSKCAKNEPPQTSVSLSSFLGKVTPGSCPSETSLHYAKKQKLDATELVDIRLMVTEKVSDCFSERVADGNLYNVNVCSVPVSAAGVNSGQAFALTASHGSAGELTDHVRIAHPAPKCKPVLKAELEHFRRDLYIQQWDRLGSLTPCSRAPSPLGRQITCRHKFEKLRWRGCPSAYYASCSACKLQRVIFYDKLQHLNFCCVKAVQAAVQTPAEGELLAKAALTEKDAKTFDSQKRRPGRPSKSKAAVIEKVAKSVGSQKRRPGRPSKSVAAVSKKDAKHLGS